MIRFQIDHATRPLPDWMKSAPMWLLVAVSLVQPLVLSAVASIAGAWLAPKAGFRSHLAERTAGLRAELPLAIALGLVAGLLLFVLDAGIFKPRVGDALETMSKAAPRASVALTVSGLFYGGITEEVLMRWGLMSAIAAGLIRVTGRGGAAAAWPAIIVVAVIFGLGHLPATRALVPLTPLLVIRAIVLNGIVGVACGWLFWKRSLESAMVAHATADTLIAAVSFIAGTA
jgi:hypothetical protein